MVYTCEYRARLDNGIKNPILTKSPETADKRNLEILTEWDSPKATLNKVISEMPKSYESNIFQKIIHYFKN